MGVILPNSISKLSDPALTEDLEAYRSRGGYRGLERALTMPPAAVVREVSESGLKGRGGAGFPTGTKWELVRAAGGAERYLVVNGAEGEPGSFKDRRLMTEAPHAVVEGLLIAAYALEASSVLFYINDEFADAVAALTEAVGEATAAGYVGAEGRVPVELHLIPETHVYIAGEETALINVLMGKPAQPWHKPPYPSTEGYQGKPTAVNNVETLAAVAVILQRGAEWFSVHRPALFSLTGDVLEPGVYELSLGTPLRDLLQEAGGPQPGSLFRAVLPGGYSMPALFPEQFDVPLDGESLRTAGSGLGASIIAVGTNRTLTEVAHEVMAFFARESCGKCPVCVKGTANMARSLEGRTHLDPEAGRAFLALALKYRHKGICSFLDTAAHFSEAMVDRLQ